MLERAAQKLWLDQRVIQQGRQQQSKGTWTLLLLTMKTGPSSAANKDKLLEMIMAEAERMITTSMSRHFSFFSLISMKLPNVARSARRS